MNYYPLNIERNEIAALGASLRAIDPRFIRSTTSSGTRRMWYQGDEPYFDLFLDFQNDEIIWFQFTLRGKTLSWDSKKPGWQTGSTNEFMLDDCNYYPAGKTIDTDDTTDWDFIKLVKSILQTRSAEEPVFAQVLSLFDATLSPTGT
ncbi:MAG: hypothetical protein VKL59_09415 [Nostocaceae cyanobacterium]|nr:hypothetical protein [Nostocaceae cyanobacterium]